ncbi:MAG TPA: hypothetical protein VIM22_03685, partial [Solirubrobacteraceae bacterium]
MSISAVGDGDRLDYREPQTRSAAAARTVPTRESLEGDRREARRKPWARVAHMKLEAGPMLNRRDGDLAGPMAQRVLDQVAEGLFHTQRIQMCAQAVRHVDRYRAPMLRRAALEAVAHATQRRRQVDIDAADRQASLIGSRDHEKVLGELRHAIGFLGRRTE